LIPEKEAYWGVSGNRQSLIKDYRPAIMHE